MYAAFGGSFSSVILGWWRNVNFYGVILVVGEVIGGGVNGVR